MKLMTSEALKRMALAHGGRLELDGKAVNSARLQVVTYKPAEKPKAEAAYMPPEPKPGPVETIEPKADPAVREAVLSIDNYAASQYLLNEANANLMQTVKDVLQKVAAQEPEKRPAQWVFKVKRDAQGLMDTITATAKY
jgi:hypothetical protein